jgi:hypothetical protein
MQVRRIERVTGLIAAAVITAAGSAVVFAQYPAGTIVPSQVLMINRAPADAIPVTLINTDPKLFPTLSVAVASSAAVDLSDRTVARLAPARQVWEYSVLSVPDVDPGARLNSAGREGWELVSVLTTPKGNSFLLKRLGR